MTEHEDDRTYGELTRLLQEANPLIFDGLTATVFNEALIEFQCERIDLMADSPVTSEEFRRAGRRLVAQLQGGDS
jgi:hypothetical protein